MGLAPNLKKRFLEHVVRFGFFVDHAADQSAQRSRVARIEFLQSMLLSLGDFLHEHFITHDRAIRAVELRKDFGEYRHKAHTSDVACDYAIGGLAYRSVGKIPMALLSGDLGMAMAKAAGPLGFSPMEASSTVLMAKPAPVRFTQAPRWTHISCPKKNSQS